MTASASRSNWAGSSNHTPPVSKRSPQALASAVYGIIVSSGTRKRAPADVASVEAARPVDRLDSGVSAGLGRRDRIAPRGDAEHAPAIGNDVAALAPRAGVKDLNV